MASNSKTTRKTRARRGAASKPASVRHGRATSTRRGRRAQRSTRTSGNVRRRKEHSPSELSHQLKYIPLDKIHNMIEDVIGADRKYIIANNAAFALGYLTEVIAQDLIKYAALALEHRPTKEQSINPEHLIAGITMNQYCANGLYRAITNPNLRSQIEAINTRLNTRMNSETVAMKSPSPRRKRSPRKSKSPSRAASPKMQEEPEVVKKNPSRRGRPRKNPELSESEMSEGKQSRARSPVRTRSARKPILKKSKKNVEMEDE